MRKEAPVPSHREIATVGFYPFSALLWHLVMVIKYGWGLLVCLLLSSYVSNQMLGL